jgi:hypothetical protein
MKNIFLTVGFVICSILAVSAYGFKEVSSSEAIQANPLRGPAIGDKAGHCPVGPFGKTGDVGEYEELCSYLTSVEKCLAYLKQHVDENGKMLKAYDSAKAAFCSRTIFGNF